RAGLGPVGGAGGQSAGGGAGVDMRFLIATISLALAGCYYSPQLSDCAPTCAQSAVCPDGMTCLDGYCRLAGARGQCIAPPPGEDASPGPIGGQQPGGSCAAGQVDTQPCGKCGARSRSCDGAGAWGAFSACKNEGACTPQEKR